MNKKKNEVADMLVLLLQIGISMIVPIALMVLLSVFIVNKTGIKWISVILFIIGAAAGMRNVYMLVKKYLKKQKEPYELKREEEESKGEDHKNEFSEENETD
ncbi:MAG TPA: hypothetical protein DCR12_03995 [Lachnospiraceae bacterium]|nr:hypothetical protein [Lachnospiraceae bacterium]